MTNGAAGLDSNRIANVAKWLRAEGAVSASVALCSGFSVVVFPDGSTEPKCPEFSHQDNAKAE